MAVEITVRGEAEARYPAERAIVNLAAAVEGTGKQAAYDEAVAIQQAITSQLTELADRAAVTTWSSGHAGVSSHRPWQDNGERGQPVHAARVEITAEFIDFDRLAGFVDYWAGRDGVEITGLAWDVSESNRRRYESDLRKTAVDHAVSRAQGYADALRRGRVVATRIADPGFLDASGGGPGPYALKVAAADGADGLHLTPQPVEIRIVVDAGFTAD